MDDEHSGSLSTGEMGSAAAVAHQAHTANPWDDALYILTGHPAMDTLATKFTRLQVSESHGPRVAGGDHSNHAWSSGGCCGKRRDTLILRGAHRASSTAVKKS